MNFELNSPELNTFGIMEGKEHSASNYAVLIWGCFYWIPP